MKRLSGKLGSIGTTLSERLSGMFFEENSDDDYGYETQVISDLFDICNKTGGDIKEFENILENLKLSMLNDKKFQKERRNTYAQIREGDKKGLDLLKSLKKEIEVKVVNSINADQNTPLHLAIKAGNIKIASLLIEKGARNYAVNKEGDTPLHIAIKTGNTQIASLLIKQEERWLTKDIKEGNKSLNLAIKAGNTQIASLLIKERSEEKIYNDKEGIKMLYLVIETGQTEIASALIEMLSSELEGSSKEGNMMLNLAIETGQTKIASALIKARVRVYDKKEWDTPFHLAIKTGNIEIVSALIKAGANLNAIDKDGDTPLHFAIKNGNTELTSLLIKAGANVNIYDRKEFNAPIHFAIEKGNIELTSALIKAGASLYITNGEGNSPLYLAVKARNIKLTSLLLDAGANVNTKNNEGIIPLQDVVKGGDKEFIELLLAKGANRKSVNSTKGTIKTTQKDLPQKLKETKENITSLDFSYNDIRDDENGGGGIKVLAQFLQKNENIKELNLSSNPLNLWQNQTLNTTSSAGKELFKADTLKNITHLNLSDTGICFNGKIGLVKSMESPIDYLAQALKDNKSMIEIDLRENQIDDEGVKKLTQIVKGCPSIRELKFNTKGIKPEIIEEFKVALDKNKAPKTSLHPVQKNQTAAQSNKGSSV